MTEIIIPANTDLAKAHSEVIMELLSDVRTALKSILPDFIPSVKFKMYLDYAPHPRLIIETEDKMPDPKYPYFHVVHENEVSLRRSNE
jgi:hypothetical protein